MIEAKATSEMTIANAIITENLGATALKVVALAWFRSTRYQSTQQAMPVRAPTSSIP